MQRSLSLRISSSLWTTESGGKPPSLRDRLIEPRVGEKRMFNIPSMSNVKEVVVNKTAVQENKDPQIVFGDGDGTASLPSEHT